MRDVAVTALVVTLGFVALAVVTGHAYASLPIGSPARPSPATLGGIASPHGPEPACAACHLTHTATDPALLTGSQTDSSICTRCHNGTYATEASTHSNIDFAARAQARFSVTCTSCHDPHGDPASGNKNMVRSSIGGLDVNFTSMTGPGSLDDGMDNGLHDSVCVVCHTTTAHNNVGSTEWRTPESHNPVGGDCTSCHKHGTSAASHSGFMPDPTSTPTATAVPPTATPTDTPTATAIPPDTPTPAPGDTATPAPADTATPSPGDTATPTPTDTDTPTAAATPG
jgi:predicted CXXCH cytochrome family protein